VTALPTILPRPEHVTRRLDQIIRRGSANTGHTVGMERLMLMLTRSCDLRCSYCWVDLTEAHYNADHPGDRASAHVPTAEVAAPPGDMSPDTLRRAIDLLMRSRKPELGIQLFGGEPARRWDNVSMLFHYAWHHPDRAGRPLELLFTTNGVHLTAERLAELAGYGVTIQLSLDGDERGMRFRRGHLLGQAEAVDRVVGAVEVLNASGISWFMNATLPPAAAGEVEARYRWAVATGVPALQLNFATGMRWSADQEAQFLEGLQAVLIAHHAAPGAMRLLNERNEADPVPLCGDVIVDVDGAVYHTAALFHERRFPKLKAAYRRAHLDDAPDLHALRWPLAHLWAVTQRALAPDDLAVFEQNIRMGAAQDLVCLLTAKRLAAPPALPDFGPAAQPARATREAVRR
jgi:sulfatase maturation enzyme AslB (radical SAM superfamily)